MRSCPLVVAAGLLFGGSALAEDVQLREECGELDLEAISLTDLLSVDLDIQSTTKTDVKVEEAAAIVTVMTGRQIRDWGYGSVAELLRHVLGFYVVDDYILPNVAVRGVSSGLRGESSVIKVLVDGHSVAFHTTSGTWLGPELIPLSAVERIEIIRGPASALYGADAFLGVVNIVIRKPTSLCGVDVWAGANRSTASLGYQGDATLGATFGPVGLLMGARIERHDDSGLLLPSTSPAPLVPSWSDADDPASDLVQRSTVVLTQLSGATDTFDLQVSGYLSAIDRGGDLSPWLQLGDGLEPLGRTAVNRVAMAHGHVALDSGLELGERASLSLHGTWFRGRPTARDALDVGSTLFSVRRRFGYDGADLNLESHWTPSGRVTFVAGADGMQDEEVAPATVRVSKSDQGELVAGEAIEDPADAKLILRNVAAYVLTVLEPVSRVDLTLGARYDRHNIYGDQVSYRAGVVVEPVTDLFVKALYGSAFDAPPALLLYGVPLRSGDIIGNPELLAQRVDTFELAATARPLERLTVESSATYSLLTNKFEFSPLGANQAAQNLSEVRSFSSETRIETNIEDVVVGYLAFEANLTRRDLGRPGYQTDLVGGGNPIYPPHIGRVGVRSRIEPISSRAGVEASWFGPRRSTDPNSLVQGSVYDLPAYGLLDATVATSLVRLVHDRETELSLTIRNLLGAEAADPGFGGVDYPIRPRTWTLDVSQEL